MDLRNERGAISPVEGCLFAAMAVFAILLIALLVVAVLRFSHPPEGIPMGIAAPFAREFRLG